ncbi:hypothetical protein RHGRI_021872 [Rhododendron griersonianum]|uniref:Uncharacterized protein n=1 Tax=Rhododendron griersonianum TaxID=479676 RepID=A0AAV6JN45_9ERIC|nr:hypothetical protein RHGRI_021872 [Rhododendron griersonianum]
MDFPKPSLRSPNPILSLSSFIHQHCHRLGAELTNRLAATWPPRQKRVGLLSSSSSPPTSSSLPSSPFASVSQQEAAPRHVFDVALSSDVVSKTLAGTSVYMLNVEGIAFRFLPDPVQIKNALELKASNAKSGFDGVPVFQNEIILKALPNINEDACRPAAAHQVFLYSELLPFVYGNYFLCLQSDLLVVKKRNRRYCPVYFRKEDIEKELSTVSRASRGSGVSKHIMVSTPDHQPCRYFSFDDGLDSRKKHREEMPYELTCDSGKDCNFVNFICTVQFDHFDMPLELY